MSVGDVKLVLFVVLGLLWIVFGVETMIAVGLVMWILGLVAFGVGCLVIELSDL
jgi:purine-cytosine permease-like protein